MFFYRIESDFCALTLISPFSGTFCRLPQLFYLFFVLLVLGNSECIPALLILPPDREIAVLHIYAFPVEYKNVVDTVIKQVTVVRYKYETAL